MLCVKTVALILTTALLQIAQSQHVQHEESLRYDLFSNYSSLVRPHTQVNVYVTMVPLSLNTLAIGEQYMSVTAVYVISWEDPRLAWTPSNYGGLDSVVMPPDMIWTPPIVVENAVKAVGKIGRVDSTDARIRNSGDVGWYPPLETSTACEMKIFRYPFDTQTCFITLTSWGMSQDELMLTALNFNMTYLSASGEWDLINHWTTSGHFHDGSELYLRLNFHFTFKRKWQFYSQNLVLPIVLMSMLMCCTFALPIDSGEKMGYILTVLLSYVVFLTWVTDNLPPVSNDTSVLQVYLACVLSTGILATLLTCWVVHLHHRREDRPMTPAMKAFVTHFLLPLWNLSCFTGCCSENQRRGSDKITPLFTKSDRNPPPPQADDKNHDSDRATTKKRMPWCDSEGLDASEAGVATPPEVAPTPTWPEVAAMFDYLFLLMYVVMMSVVAVVVVGILYGDY